MDKLKAAGAEPGDQPMDTDEAVARIRHGVGQSLRNPHLRQLWPRPTLQNLNERPGLGVRMGQYTLCHNS